MGHPPVGDTHASDKFISRIPQHSKLLLLLLKFLHDSVHNVLQPLHLLVNLQPQLVGVNTTPYINGLLDSLGEDLRYPCCVLDACWGCVDCCGYCGV